MLRQNADNLLERLTDPDDMPACVAPLAGWTDAAYRKILRACGARHMWIPFVSSHAVRNAGSPNRDEYVRQVTEEGGHVQIFGAVPEVSAGAARILEAEGAISIDFNCGCSVRKVHKGGGGSALLKDLDLLKANLKAIVDAVGIPVSLKTRIGFHEGDKSGLDACRLAEDLGCAWVTLHARSARQRFEGSAAWDAIARLVKDLSVPVIGNGDIFEPRDAKRMFEETGCAGVMIGREVMGDPWIVGDCEKFLTDGSARPRRGRSELVEIMLAHQKEMLDHYPDRRGVWEFRKHIAKYLRGFALASKLRSALVREDDPEVVARMLGEFGEGKPPDRIIE